MKRAAAALLWAAAAIAPVRAEERALYRASGADARLFDQYDNDGYSLDVTPRADGSLALSVRVSDAPLASRAPFPAPGKRDESLPPAPDRDAFAANLAAESRTQQDAVRRVLLGLAAQVRYDPDRLRRQDPSAVFASRRAYCVGFSELAVDLLRRAGLAARTVQGVLRTRPGSDRYDPSIEGTYHRWIEVYYPDRGYVFSDPSHSINGVDARYLPFGRRALAQPRHLRLTAVSLTGSLAYESFPAGQTSLRVRTSAP